LEDISSGVICDYGEPESQLGEPDRNRVEVNAHQVIAQDSALEIGAAALGEPWIKRNVYIYENLK
jgi:hypothetical protein